MTAIFLKVLAVLLLAASAVLAIGQHKQEYAFLLSLSCGAAVMMLLAGQINPHITYLKSAFEKAGGAASCFTVALKALGLSYLTGFVADTCRDFGQSALAAKAEFAGKCAIFILCVPPAVNLLETALKFAGI